MSEVKQNMEVNQVDESFLDDFFGDSTTTTASQEVIDKNKTAADNIKTISSTEEPSEINIYDLKEEEEEEEKEIKKETKEEEEEAIKVLDHAASSNEGEVDSISVIQEMIKENVLLGFEDQEIKTNEDLKELIAANIKHAQSQPVKEFQEEFFSSLPQEIKIAYDYAQKGASEQEIKSLFKTFSEAAEVKELDPSTDEGQREIVRQYLQDTDFGTSEEIKEQIDEWDDTGKLESRAFSFHAKLEKNREKTIQQKLEQQKIQEKNKIEFQQNFINNVKSATEKPTFVNLKLNKSERVKLEKDLLENNYVSSISKRPLNALGKILEEISFVNPNPEFLAEITYFATNPEGFIEKITESVKEKNLSKTIKKLKTNTISKPTSAATKEKTIRYRGINEMN